MFLLFWGSHELMAWTWRYAFDSLYHCIFSFLNDLEQWPYTKWVDQRVATGHQLPCFTHLDGIADFDYNLYKSTIWFWVAPLGLNWNRASFPDDRRERHSEISQQNSTTLTQMNPETSCFFCCVWFLYPTRIAREPSSTDIFMGWTQAERLSRWQRVWKPRGRFNGRFNVVFHGPFGAGNNSP
jgi:hypothetical protein